VTWNQIWGGWDGLGTESLRVLWLSLPVVLAALVQTIVLKLKLGQRWATPLDFGKTFRDKRLFGDNKTWRGAVVYVVFSVLFTIPQATFWRVPSLEYFDYTQTYLPWAIDLGLLLGLGFVLGELPNSFLKRQQGIGPGQSGKWWNAVLDQVDSLLGVLILLIPLRLLPLKAWLGVLIICTVLHSAFGLLFVVLGLKKSVY